jgi:hypothetical protein
LARSRASLESIRPPAAGREKFLAEIADILDRLRTEAQWRGHPLLASLIEIARGEAEDELKSRSEMQRTPADPVRVREHGIEEDDGVLRMAEKLAKRQRQ